MQDQIVPQPSEWVVCNLCGKDDAKVIFHERGFTIVRCAVCGLVYVNPRLGQKELSGLYKDVTRSESEWYKRIEAVTGEKVTAPGVTPGTDVCELRDRYYASIIQRVSTIIRKKSGTILDVGCGPGAFVNFARSCGWEAYGFDIVEPREGLVKDLAKNAIIVADDLEKAGLPEGNFDVVTLWHVLEHTRDPARYIQSAHRLLAENGVLIIAVPNYHWLRFKAWFLKSFLPENYCFRSPHFNKWGYFFPEEHLYNFSLSTLSAYLDTYGFKKIKIYIDLPYQKKTYLSDALYVLLMLIARSISVITFGNIHTYMNLTVVAQKKNEKR